MEKELQIIENAMPGDSLVLAAGDRIEMTATHAPMGVVGRFLSRFFVPAENIQFRVAYIRIAEGVPVVRLDVESAT
jgi:hypothetical protein